MALLSNWVVNCKSYQVLHTFLMRERYVSLITSRSVHLVTCVLAISC